MYPTGGGCKLLKQNTFIKNMLGFLDWLYTV
jgi:hypothetical protein